MDGCCSRASAFASWRNRASMPGVHAISGWSTLQASRRSRSLSHSSYTSANPPRPTRRRTSYLDPSPRASRSAVVLIAFPLSGTERGAGGEGRPPRPAGGAGGGGGGGGPPLRQGEGDRGRGGRDHGW